MDKVILYKRNVGDTTMYSVDKNLDEIYFLASLDMNDSDDPDFHGNSHVDDLIFYKNRYPLDNSKKYEISNSHCIGGVTDFMTGRVLEPMGIYDSDSYAACSYKDFENKDDLLNKLNSNSNYVIFSANTHSKNCRCNHYSNIKFCGYMAENFFKSVSIYNSAQAYKICESGDNRVNIFSKMLSNYIDENGKIFQNFEIGDIRRNDDTYFEKCVRDFSDRQFEDWYQLKPFEEYLIDVLIESIEYVKKSIDECIENNRPTNHIISKLEYEKYAESLKGKRVKLKTLDELRAENIYTEKTDNFEDNLSTFNAPCVYTGLMINRFGGKTATITSVDANYYYLPSYITKPDFKCLLQSQIRHTLKYGYIMCDDTHNNHSTEETYDSETINNTNILIKNGIIITLNFDDEAARNSQHCYNFSIGMCKILED